MISKKIEKKLNDQVASEAYSSHLYLSMASWAEVEGLDGTAEFLFRHSDEERMHMLKLVRFINERGGKAIIPAMKQPVKEFKSLAFIFQSILKHEQEVTDSIHDIVDLCLKEKDYSTHNFMQWYVAEQIEEEGLARTIISKLDMIGNDKGGLYLFDRDLMTMTGDEGK